MKRILSRLKGSAAAFHRDENGSIIIQMVAFSLLLLGATGLVLDSGRVFVSHSQMQAYADQMALAAANELDGQDDAILRAARAVFGTNERNPYLQKIGVEVGLFQTKSVSFYSTMAPTSKLQSDTTEAFPNSALVAVAQPASDGGDPVITYTDGDAVAASNAALFAVAQANEAKTQSTVANMISGQDLFLSYDAVAAASLTENNCAEMSTLVFCNPWENALNSPLDVPTDDPLYSVPGRSVNYFAPNYPNPLSGGPVTNGKSEFNSIYEWDTKNQLFTLASPLVDPGEVCSPTNVPRLAPGEDYIIARDRCLMARANRDLVCWGADRDLTITPAHGPSVSRAVNTAFDIWMEPFDTAITNTTEMPGTGLGFHQFFEPDIIATTTFEPSDWRGEEPTTPADLVAPDGRRMQDNDPSPEFTELAAQQVYQQRFLGDAAPSFDHTVVPNLHASGITVDLCHLGTYQEAVGVEDNGLACSDTFVGDYYEGAPGALSYPSEFIDTYWSNLYTNPAPGSFTGDPATENAALCISETALEEIPGLSDFCEVFTLPDEVDTWYEVYQRERQLFSQLATNPDRSRVHVNGRWCGTDPDSGVNGVDVGHCGDPNANDGGDLVSRYGLSSPDEGYIKHGPADYFGLTGDTTLFAPDRERRRLRAAMVNCEAVTSLGLNNEGTYSVSVDNLRIMDMYIPRPVTQFCGEGVLACDTDVSFESWMYVEMIEDQTEEIQTTYTAHLVR